MNVRQESGTEYDASERKAVFLERDLVLAAFIHVGEGHRIDQIPEIEDIRELARAG